MANQKILPLEWDKFSKQQKLEWIVDNNLVDDYLDQITLKHSRAFIRDRLIQKKNNPDLKCKCLSCGTSLGLKPKSLSEGVLEFALVLLQLSIRDLESVDLKAYNLTFDFMLDWMPSFHQQKDNVNKDGRKGVRNLIYEKTGRDPSGYADLVYWDFIEKDWKERNPLVLGRGKTNGFWIPTRKLYNFVYKGLQVPEECTIHDGEVLWGTKLITFSQYKLLPYADRQKFRTTYF